VGITIDSFLAILRKMERALNRSERIGPCTRCDHAFGVHRPEDGRCSARRCDCPEFIAARTVLKRAANGG